MDDQHEMTLDDLITYAAAGRLSLEALQEHCAIFEKSLGELCDVLASLVAEDYLSGRVDYDYGDLVMNNLFQLMSSEPFFAVTDRAMPEKAFAIYQAFDAGEYRRDGDSPSEVPHEKYTRPGLLVLLGPQRVI